MSLIDLESWNSLYGLVMNWQTVGQNGLLLFLVPEFLNTVDIVQGDTLLTPQPNLNVQFQTLSIQVVRRKKYKEFGCTNYFLGKFFCKYFNQQQQQQFNQ